MLFVRFLADIEQLNLFGLFATDGRLRGTRAFERKARRFLNIFTQSMTIQGDNQRNGVGMDQLDAIFIINVLLPKRRQMHFDGVEIIAPFIGIVGGDAIARDRARHA
ncbi:hypothetical protein D3C78_1355990 [compost metagenome]